MGNSLHESYSRKTIGGGKLHLSCLCFSHRGYLSISTAPHGHRCRLLARLRALKLSWRDHGRKWGRKALPVGWGTTLPTRRIQPDSGSLLFRLLRLAPWRSLKASLPSSPWSIVPRRFPSPQRRRSSGWRQDGDTTSPPFRALFTICEPLPAQSPPRPSTLRHFLWGLRWMGWGRESCEIVRAHSSNLRQFSERRSLTPRLETSG